MRRPEGPFERLCKAVDTPELLADPDFASNALRVHNRERLVPLIEAATRTRSTARWMEALEAAGVPCAPVNTIVDVFADPRIVARGMEIGMAHPLAGEDVRLVGSPVGLSRTPISYRRAPPTLGQHTDEVLAEMLDLSESERDALRGEGVIRMRVGTFMQRLGCGRPRSRGVDSRFRPVPS